MHLRPVSRFENAYWNVISYLFYVLARYGKGLIKQCRWMNGCVSTRNLLYSHAEKTRIILLLNSALIALFQGLGRKTTPFFQLWCYKVTL